MAEVWEAVDEVLTRPVAVKILLPHLAADKAFVARFRREAISAARLSDPHIVSIYDTCSEGDVEAIVMELVRGATLRQLLDDQGHLHPNRAVEIAVQVADALEHAHRNGLVHRDVKPGNILLSDDGRVLVADFGIAKAAEGGADLTEVGQVVGTAKYLSPEQVEGTPLDARSDVYAVGVVLYEMLCGRPPFDGGQRHHHGRRPAHLPTPAPAPGQSRHPPGPRGDRDAGHGSSPGGPLRLGRRPPSGPGTDRPAQAGAGRRPHGGRVRGRRHLGVPVLGGSRRAVVRARHGPVRRLIAEARPSTAGAPVGPHRATWLVPAALIVVVAATLGVVAVLVGRTDMGQDLFDVVEARGPGAGGKPWE